MDKKQIIYRIHPAIGFARVGGGSEFFIGPEVPGYGATGRDAGRGSDIPPYKEVPSGPLKRQAARFRVWRYTWDKTANKYIPDPQDLADSEVKIKWTVELANRKASFFEFHGTNGEDPAAAFNPRRRNRRVTVSREAALEITPGPRSIWGASQGPKRFDVSIPGLPITYLGEILTDNKGRLLVLGGLGKSMPSSTLAAAGGLKHPVPLATYANNPTWFDDISDGPVTAELEFKSGETVSWEDVEPAWVIVGPPDFAPGLRSVVSLHDTLVDVWVRNARLDVSGASGAPLWMRDMRCDFNAASGFTNFTPNFIRDVYPFLQAVMNMRWVHAPAQEIHKWDWAKLSDPSGAGSAYRKSVFQRIRVPQSLTGLPKGINANMPKLIGDEQIDEYTASPVDEDAAADTAASRRRVSAPGGPKSWWTVTAVQYAVMRQWMLGKFDPSGWPRSNKPSDLAPPPKTVTPLGLDQSALENCIGGAFFPGIEVGWLIRNPVLYESPHQTSVFRLNFWTWISGRERGVAVLTVQKDVGGRPILRKIHYGSKVGGEDLPMHAGFFSQQMALPWQADFLACCKQYHDGEKEPAWWPTQRPDDVHVLKPSMTLKTFDAKTFDVTVGMQKWDDKIVSREHLVDHFQKLGFVRAADAIGDSRPNRDTVYVELERDPIPP
ncbi:LodA/GoxA family CTQ-dependent oxidase [Sorangium sp. So ce1151]|uniref:LodA/GoxA family CTQ-dependent oxidase n=1 Tax=Sorangium sp. So ce1151 TaxID=3133332 RepID=UPI003F629080